MTAPTERPETYWCQWMPTGPHPQTQLEAFDDEDAAEAHAGWLTRHGVVYVTVFAAGVVDAGPEPAAGRTERGQGAPQGSGPVSLAIRTAESGSKPQACYSTQGPRETV